jgi:hypothetical protein
VITSAYDFVIAIAIAIAIDIRTTISATNIVVASSGTATITLIRNLTSIASYLAIATTITCS